MPFVPHTEEEIREMLEVIGVQRIEALFSEIPPELRAPPMEGMLPKALNEMEIGRLMRERAAQDGQPLCFIGAGAYEHHVPAAVWEIATRGEFYTAYTPYQAEASQGTLQLLYEYQTMMASLTGMEISNASLYDGASALAEAVLMAVRANRRSKSKRVLIPATVHPVYRKVVRTIVTHQGIEVVELPYCTACGNVVPDSLAQYSEGDYAALVVPQPNFFGVLEEVDRLTDWAHTNGTLVIGLINPIAAAILAPPGEWGETGADIACGEGQPLGIPLSSGGPYFGFLCCRESLVRQMPGRIVGRTVDLDGKPGFTLTLQAREQHIRRSKATSNICTNQGLMTTAATLYLSLLGPEGLERVASACHGNTRRLLEKVVAIEGVEPLFDGEFFHEVVLRVDRPVNRLLERLAGHQLLAGHSLAEDYPELGDAFLLCCTETKTEADLERFATLLRETMSEMRSS